VVARSGPKAVHPVGGVLDLADPEQTEEIQPIAEAAGIPAAGLVRGWVLQGLAAEREESVEQVVEALSRDVARLRRQLTERQAS
jgi:hypothetical protein